MGACSCLLSPTRTRWMVSSTSEKGSFVSTSLARLVATLLTLSFNSFTLCGSRNFMQNFSSRRSNISSLNSRYFLCFSCKARLLAPPHHFEACRLARYDLVFLRGRTNHVNRGHLFALLGHLTFIRHLDWSSSALGSLTLAMSSALAASLLASRCCFAALLRVTLAAWVPRSAFLCHRPT